MPCIRPVVFPLSLGFLGIKMETKIVQEYSWLLSHAYLCLPHCLGAPETNTINYSSHCCLINVTMPLFTSLCLFTSVCPTAGTQPMLPPPLPTMHIGSLHPSLWWCQRRWQWRWDERNFRCRGRWRSWWQSTHDQDATDVGWVHFRSPSRIWMSPRQLTPTVRSVV